jgi:RND superfamily putative drug exporter
VAFLASVTLLPAILVLAGRRGWIKARGNQTNRFWRRTGTRVVRRPWIRPVAATATANDQSTSQTIDRRSGLT